MRREFRGEVRLQTRGDGEDPVITGHAAMFRDFYDIGRPGTPWHFRERIMPGAFRDVIDGEPEDTAGLYNHNPDQLLGRYSAGTLRLSEDDAGLSYEIDADTEDEIGRRVVRKIDRGELKGNSFSFEIEKDGQEWEENEDDGVMERTINRVSALWDVGPVVYPANPTTSLALRELREAGFDVPDLPEGRAKPEIILEVGDHIVEPEQEELPDSRSAAVERARDLRVKEIRRRLQ